MTDKEKIAHLAGMVLDFVETARSLCAGHLSKHLEECESFAKECLNGDKPSESFDYQGDPQTWGKGPK